VHDLPTHLQDPSPGMKTLLRTDAQIMLEIARLRNESSALKQRGTEGVFFRVSEKGAVSVYMGWVNFQ
jgi:hypothetical protein